MILSGGTLKKLSGLTYANYETPISALIKFDLKNYWKIKSSPLELSHKCEMSTFN